MGRVLRVRHLVLNDAYFHLRDSDYARVKKAGLRVHREMVSKRVHRYDDETVKDDVEPVLHRRDGGVVLEPGDDDGDEVAAEPDDDNDSNRRTHNNSTKANNCPLQ